MGIDNAFALQLLGTAPLVAGNTSAVMLGRQNLALKCGNTRPLRRTLDRARLSTDLSDYAQEDRLAETFLTIIGFPPVKTMDASDYEHCDYTHDKNDPLAVKLHGAFDVIIKGGTIPYSIRLVRSTMYSTCSQKDGVFISINGMQGWAGHGFYQFGPELVLRYWQDARNCIVHTCVAVPIDPEKDVPDAPHTGKAGARFRARGMEGRWYLYYIGRKTAQGNCAESITRTHQGDYAVQWNRANAHTPQEAGA